MAAARVAGSPVGAGRALEGRALSGTGGGALDAGATGSAPSLLQAPVTSSNGTTTAARSSFLTPAIEPVRRKRRHFNPRVHISRGIGVRPFPDTPSIVAGRTFGCFRPRLRPFPDTPSTVSGHGEPACRHLAGTRVAPAQPTRVSRVTGAPSPA
ncbi:hypothetical protein Acsp01_20350 [Actinoplanes sp. NBRC 101535]|nr:hypothetical protein Acsp01_20350 [Actinoplanes sp. NBRC 101535]